ncbi:Rrf2 family transcriptional regulator [Inquilinus sp. KBS0705]|nr:Rrf2 family transcriptional regulator [Inquilinus sp. KBS0705]
MNGRFPTALHIMTLLCSADEQLSSEFLAGSINVNPVLVRKELSNLIKHQLVYSKAGKSGGYTLSKPAMQITLANIYTAVKSTAILGNAKNEPNPKCPVGKQINQHLDEINKQVDQSVMQKLGNTTLADFTNKFN